MLTSLTSPTSTMSPNHTLARAIYEGYPHNDLLSIDPAKDCADLKTLCSAAKNCGDTLFHFICAEILEGATFDHNDIDLERAIELMERAQRDIEAVIDKLSDLDASEGETNLNRQSP